MIINKITLYYDEKTIKQDLEESGVPTEKYFTPEEKSLITQANPSSFTKKLVKPSK